jgi:Peptidase M15
MESLSTYFSWAEANITNHRGVDNTIPNDLRLAIKNTAQKMDIIRRLLSAPIIVSSWYRSPTLNKLVGGSKTSQHMKGEAVDFICPGFGEPKDVCKHLVNFTKEINFDQLILEHSWVHISFNALPTIKQRNQVLSLLKNKKLAHGLTDTNGNPLFT